MLEQEVKLERDCCYLLKIPYMLFHSGILYFINGGCISNFGLSFFSLRKLFGSIKEYGDLWRFNLMRKIKLSQIDS